MKVTRCYFDNSFEISMDEWCEEVDLFERVWYGLRQQIGAPTRLKLLKEGRR